MKSTKKSLLLSALSLLLCFAMLVGTTFAWFTDSVTSGVNKIVAGNLDVELEYYNGSAWNPVTSTTKLFNDSALWEPGHTEVAYLKISNAGTLALKYNLAINIANEVAGTNVADETFKLSNYINMGVVETWDGTAPYADRAAARAAVTSAGNIATYSKVGSMVAGANAEYLAIVVYMPEEVDNVANYKTTTTAPSIELGVNVTATQLTSESDSFDNQYDKNASIDQLIGYHGEPLPTAPTMNGDVWMVTPANAQYTLDGAYGSINGKTIVLSEGTYPALEFARATKFDASATELVCQTHSSQTFANTAEFIEHMSDSNFHTTPKYTRTVSNVTIKAADSATVSVAGVKASSGHVYGIGSTDYVRDFTRTAVGSTCYVNLDISNVTFEGLTFTAKSDIASSQPETVINGVTFKNCTFNIANTEPGNQAIRYYNENDNGKVKNLTVDHCTFNNCYQGIYCGKINGVSVTACTFDTTGHNAIGLQGGEVPCNLGAVVITGNTFTNIGDRIIRFNNVGANTQITIRNNTATSSGDSAGEVIKATSLAEGITYNISGNDWGAGRVVVNDELKDSTT